MSEDVPLDPISPIEPASPTSLVSIEPLPVANQAPQIASPTLGKHLTEDELRIKPARLLSLDVFRGITLAMMTVVNNTSGDTYYQFDHAVWGKGWTATDLVFPFFLFIVGVAIPFSLSKRSTVGQTKRQLLGTIWLRTLSLFMVGQLLQGIGNLKGAWDPPRHFVTLPPEFHVLHVLRWIAVIYAYTALIFLLAPWRPTRRAWLLPVSIGVSFYGLASIMAWANHYAMTHGAPDDTYLGIGLLKPGSMRIPGILQRISFCYGLAATVMLYFSWRTALLTSVVTCTVYTLLMFYAPFHDPVSGQRLKGVIEEQHNFARAVDETVFDRYTIDANGKRQYQWRHAYNPYPDNEGLLSTLPAIASALIGAMAGLWLLTLRPAGEKCAGLFVFGVLAILLGLFLDAHSLPILKTIWTPSYAIFTAGLALMGLGIIYFTVDINGYRRWSWPFIVLGMNSIAVFVANNFVYRINNMFDVPTPYRQAAWNNVSKDRILFGQAWQISVTGAVHQFGDWFHTHISPNIANAQNAFAPHGSLIINEANASLAYAFTFLLVIWLLMLVLYACKVFAKI